MRKDSISNIAKIVVWSLFIAFFMNNLGMDRSITERMSDGWEYFISLLCFFILSVVFVFLIKFSVSYIKGFDFMDLLKVSVVAVILSGAFVAGYMVYFRNMSIERTTLFKVDLPVMLLFAGLTSLWFWKEKQGNKSTYILEDVNEEMNTLHKKYGSTDRVIEAYHGRNTIQVKIEDIHLIYRVNGINYVMLKDHSKYRIDMPLKDFDDLINDTQYFRANRSLIVNRAAIVSYSQENRKLILTLTMDDKDLNTTVGKNKITEFKGWFVNKAGV